MDPQPNIPPQPVAAVINQQLQDKVDALGAEIVLQRVFTRVAHIFTAEDANTLEQVSSTDQTGDAVKYFLRSIVPNFDAIVDEEVKRYQEEEKK